MYVIFQEKTGKILGISAKNEHENTIPVEISEVQALLDGKEKKKNYRVEYDPKTKQLVLVNRHRESFDGSCVNDFIYEIPESDDSDADITVEQDIPSACWRISLGSSIKKNLDHKGIRLNTRLHFSVTAPHDPNVLFRTLDVDFMDAAKRDCAVVDFTMPFEYKNIPFSVFTTRRFDTYQLKRISDE